MIYFPYPIRILDLYFNHEEKHANMLEMSLITTVQNNAAVLSMLREKGRLLETSAVRGIPEKLVKLKLGK